MCRCFITEKKKNLMNKGLVRELIYKKKNDRAGWPTGLVSEMVKWGGEARIDMTTNMIKQTMVEKAIPEEWKFNTIVNCYQGKRDALERRNVRTTEINRSDPEKR